MLPGLGHRRCGDQHAVIGHQHDAAVAEHATLQALAFVLAPRRYRRNSCRWPLQVARSARCSGRSASAPDRPDRRARWHRAGADAATRDARRRTANRAEGQRLRKMLQYENALWATGVLRVADVDEAGMSHSRRPGICGGGSVCARISASLASTIPRNSTRRRANGLPWKSRSPQSRGQSVSSKSTRSTPSISIGPGILALRGAVEGLSCCPITC